MCHPFSLPFKIDIDSFVLLYAALHDSIETIQRKVQTQLKRRNELKKLYFFHFSALGYIQLPRSSLALSTVHSSSRGSPIYTIPPMEPYLEDNLVHISTAVACISSQRIGSFSLSISGI